MSQPHSAWCPQQGQMPAEPKRRPCHSRPAGAVPNNTANAPSGYSCTRTVALTKCGAQPARRQLQAQPLPLHRVVVAHRPILLDAQDLAPCPHRISHERRTLLLRGDREPRVVLRDVGLARASGWPPRPWRSRPAPAPSAGGPAASRTPAPNGRAPAASKPRCARCRAASARGRTCVSTVFDTGPPPPAYGSSGCPGRYRASRTGRASPPPRARPAGSTPCPPHPPGTSSRSRSWRRPSSPPDRACRASPGSQACVEAS